MGCRLCVSIPTIIKRYKREKISNNNNLNKKKKAFFTAVGPKDGLFCNLNTESKSIEQCIAFYCVQTQGQEKERKKNDLNVQNDIII